MKIILFHFDTTAMWSATAGPLLDIASANAAKKATEKTVAKASAIVMATFPGGCPTQISATGNLSAPEKQS